ncbi:MAG: hypothetical protein JWP65_3577 [Ramlibacter sp.]|jgi:hypothetical protein|nr:hypothetical protein [Ramlibacter sp.]
MGAQAARAHHNGAMATVLTFLVRVLLVSVGLVFAAIMACFFVLMLGIWLLAAAWATLTGKPVSPFVVRMGPRDAFEQMRRRAQAQQPATRTPRSDAAAGPRSPTATEVTDVEAK